jgi:hypothetical protein
MSYPPIPIATVLEHVRAYRQRQGPEDLLIEGVRVRVSKAGLRTFALNGTCCVTCQLEGSHFEMVDVPAKGTIPAHASLQLVALKEGQRVVFTQDHTWARALGGSNHPSNLTTMCGPCNHRKAQHEMALVLRLREEAGLLPDGRHPRTLATPHLGAALREAGKYHLWVAQAQTHGAPRPAPPLDEARVLELKLRLASRAAALGLTPAQYRNACEQVATTRTLPPEERRLEGHAAQMAMSLGAYRTFQDEYGSRLETAAPIAHRLQAMAVEAGIALRPPRVIATPPATRRRLGTGLR